VERWLREEVVRDDLLSGLRVTGFERRVTIAFIVTAEAVLIEGIFYGGPGLRGGVSRSHVKFISAETLAYRDSHLLSEEVGVVRRKSPAGWRCGCCHQSPLPRCFMGKSDEQELVKIKASLIERNPYGLKLQSFDDMAREIFSVRRAYYPIIPKTPWLLINLINRRRPNGKPGEVSIPKETG
jgi:hypothetical protein